MPDVILPVLDERLALPWVLDRMPTGYRPIVVDNGSTDGSAELAASLGALVVHEPKRGFGAACWAGLAAAAADVSPRTVYRWLAQDERRPRGRREAWVLPDRAFELLVTWRGDEGSRCQACGRCGARSRGR